MTDLSWEAFLALRGDPTNNWEVLCRELVRRHYGSYGPLLTRKQQPGVEFHLPIAQPGSDLGDPPRHWGWQCRWYAPDAFRSSGRLKSEQRREIEAAIEKSVRHVDGLTDWVLWTREKLNAEDERWFRGLEAPFTLHPWDEETVVGMLTGSSEILRETWFGELALTDDVIRGLWREAIAPIKARYVEELHVRTPAEQSLDLFLPDAPSATRLASEEVYVVEVANQLEEAKRGQRLDTAAREAVGEVERALAVAIARLREIGETLAQGDLPRADAVLLTAPDIDVDLHRSTVISLRDARADAAARALGNGLRAVERARGLLDDLASHLRTPLVAAVGGAGAGKTHLAGHLTGPEDRPRGILALARQTGDAITDNDIAVIGGLPGRSRDDLLEALEAIGARRGRRVPLVIDGLNESNDPRRWKDVLSRLNARLSELPHVLGVVTVRPKYVSFAVPDDLPTVQLPGFAGVEAEAIERYFSYYRIDASHEDLHWWPPNHPILLSVFCRTVNPDRDHAVTAEDLPDSLADVFDAYLGDIHDRVGTAMEIEPGVVANAVLDLAHRFFAEGGRDLDLETTRDTLGDGQRASWRDSLRFRLESEELLGRDVIRGHERMVWTYDLLAGHVIAKSILRELSDPDDVRDPDFLEALERHPLAEDIVTGLTGLLGNQGVDLPRLVEDREQLVGMSTAALPRLPASALAGDPSAAMQRAFVRAPIETLDALAATAFVPEHPLNAQLLDRLLGDLEVWKRDLAWTEWVRGRSETVLIQVIRLAEEWRHDDVPDDDGVLVWLSWLLTTTDKRLRDEATHALYRFGLRAPQRLFSRAVEMLDVNDAFVAEGLLAASYGVAMAAQDPHSELEPHVRELADRLEAELLSETAPRPTYHWLLREYAHRTTQLAAWLRDGTWPPGGPQPPLPQPPAEPGCLPKDSAEWEAVSGAFHMDFSNYTIGRLVPDRRNYDSDHPRFVEVTGEIRWRVADLGWTADRFEAIDRPIAEGTLRRALDPEKVERYGKKYSWIGFYEAAGRLSDAGELPIEDGRLSELPIDPSFPEPAPVLPIGLPAWSPGVDDDDRSWIEKGPIEIPDELLRPAELDGEAGPWIAVDGFLRHQPPGTDRKVFCFIRGLAALEGWSTVTDYLSRHTAYHDVLPRPDTDYYCFWGEAPWSATFDSAHTAADGRPRPHVRDLGSSFDPGPEVELLSLDFGWESYHSLLNPSEAGSRPTKAFAKHVGLRMLPNGSQLVDASGQPIAKAFSLPPHSWSGHLLYVREDQLREYCQQHGREWGWVAWGERELLPEGQLVPPDWLSRVRRRGDDRFVRVVALSEL